MENDEKNTDKIRDMRKILIDYLGKIKEVPLISSKRDGQERIVKIKGLFNNNPEHISAGVLSVKENREYELGNYARVKGGLFKVKQKERPLLKISVPSWKAYLYISLFNADGGDGYSDDEIADAQKFIHENKLASLLKVSEPVDGEITCVFSRRF